MTPNNQPHPTTNKNTFLADPTGERFKKGFCDEQKAPAPAPFKALGV
jgi:hypothetical protein